MAPDPIPPQPRRPSASTQATSPGRRRRPHPAQHARTVATRVSIAAFATLTGAFAVGAAVSHPTTATPAPVTTTTAANVSSSSDAPTSPATNDDSWSATAGTTSSAATTQSHGS